MLRQHGVGEERGFIRRWRQDGISFFFFFPWGILPYHGIVLSADNSSCFFPFNPQFPLLPRNFQPICGPGSTVRLRVNKAKVQDMSRSYKCSPSPCPVAIRPMTSHVNLAVGEEVRHTKGHTVHPAAQPNAFLSSNYPGDLEERAPGSIGLAYVPLRSCQYARNIAAEPQGSFFEYAHIVQVG